MICTGCRSEKDQGHFGPDKSRPSGLDFYCRDCRRVKTRARYHRSPELHRERMLARYRANPRKRSAQMARWRAANKDKIRRAWNERYQRDPDLRLRHIVSVGLRQSLNGTKGGTKWTEILGYSVADLRLHLERQFSGSMSWENFGSYWHVDHIRPVSMFVLPRDLAECWALTNLRPLRWLANLQKGAVRQHLL